MAVKRVPLQAAAAQLSALGLFADANGDVIAHAGVKVGSFTRDLTLASGTQAITGVGFKPSSVIFFGTVAGAWETVWGMSDGTTNNVIRTQAGGVVFQLSTTVAMLFEVAGGWASAVVASFDTDGFTLTWTKNTTPTGTATIMFETFR